MFQSRPAKGDLLRVIGNIHDNPVSIHAPAKGGAKLVEALNMMVVSIHAPARGAT